MERSNVSITDEQQTISKVLLLDASRELAPLIEQFCADNQLVTLKTRRSSVMGFLRTNVDLGGILLSENYAESSEDTLQFALDIRALRPELPIMLRREQLATLDDLPGVARALFCTAYTAGNLDVLRRAVAKYVFSLNYPKALLRGIGEISESALKSEFHGFSVAAETPYVVHDRVVFGELFSLIPLESNWCRGYLMLQTDEDGVAEMLDRTGRAGKRARLAGVNDRLREATNLIWGLFKNRYVGDRSVSADSNVQVPLIFNLPDRSISFGASNTHLCCPYRITDEQHGRSFWLYERFMFNLRWSPDDFADLNPPSAAQGAPAGGLEFF